MIRSEEGSSPSASSASSASSSTQTPRAKRQKLALSLTSRLDDDKCTPKNCEPAPPQLLRGANDKVTTTYAVVERHHPGLHCSIHQSQSQIIAILPSKEQADKLANLYTHRRLCHSFCNPYLDCYDVIWDDRTAETDDITQHVEWHDYQGRTAKSILSVEAVNMMSIVSPSVVDTLPGPLGVKDLEHYKEMYLHVNNDICQCLPHPPAECGCPDSGDDDSTDDKHSSDGNKDDSSGDENNCSGDDKDSSEGVEEDSSRNEDNRSRDDEDSSRDDEGSSEDGAGSSSDDSSRFGNVKVSTDDERNGIEDEDN